MRVIGPGPRNLITDVAGLRVGNASDERVKSGATVLTGDAPFVAAVDIRGGAPGTRETDLLAPDKLVRRSTRWCWRAVRPSGSMRPRASRTRCARAGAGSRAGQHVPIVPAAILFDLVNGGDKGWDDNPYRRSARRRSRRRRTDFALGTAGAGTGGRDRDLKGGLGSASLVLESGVTVGALVAVNALGGVTAPGSRHFCAAPWEIGGEFGGLGPAPGPLARPTSAGMLQVGDPEPGTNTTIAIVATDAALDKAEATAARGDGA